MRAQKIFERLNFERGQDPRRSLRVGRNQSALYRALTDPEVEKYQIDEEGFRQWLSENPWLSMTLKYDKDPLPIENYLTFDLDWYCEEHNIDQDEIMNDFMAPDFLPPKIHKPGQLRPRLGFIKSLPRMKVIYYQGGNVDGFITRKDWLGLNESVNFERGLDPKLSMDIGVTQTIVNKWEEFLKELGIRSLSLEKSLNGKWHLVTIPFEIATPKIIYSKIQRYFGDYIGPTYRRKNSNPEISVMIKPEFVKNFIRAYNIRYPDFPLEDK